MNTTTGLDRARKTAGNIKKDVEASKVTKREPASERKVDEQSMIAIQGSEITPKVANFFKDNAEVGTKNMSGGALPQLKITESNSTNLDIGGNKVPAGNFYYSPTKEYFEEEEVAMMTISRGFYAMTKGTKKNPPEPKFNQLVGGMILSTLQPFVMFISGTRLNNMWKFAKEISPLTKDKDCPIPMMAIRVALKLEEIKTDFGTNHVVKFDLVKNKEGDIQFLDDLKLLETIKSGVSTIEDTFKNFIENKEVDKHSGKPLSGQVVRDAEEVFEDPRGTNSEPVSHDDIPF